MTNLSAILRSLAMSAILAGTSVVALPAMAAQADIDMLGSYIGNWKGRGTMTGAETESVACKLTLLNGNDQKINYTGKCILAGTNLSIKGTIAYVDAAKRYEAAMTTNASFSGIAVGKKQPGGVFFNLKERDTSDGQDMAITAGIGLINEAIKVTFRVVDTKTGGAINANIAFTK